MPKQESILIIGAGLCGSLLALRLGQRGFRVRVIEMRQDLRKVDISACNHVLHEGSCLSNY